MKVGGRMTIVLVAVKYNKLFFKFRMQSRERLGTLMVNALKFEIMCN